MGTNVKTVNDVNTNKFDIFMLAMVVMPLVLSIISLVLFMTGMATTFHPLWLVVLLLINAFVLPIIDLILLSANGVSFNEPVISSVLCFPMYVYFREKMTDNNKPIFIISIISYIVSIFMFFLHILSNGVELGSTIIYILGIYGTIALLLKLFSTKDDKDSVYMIYMINTVVLLVLAIAIHIMKVVLKL